MNPTSPVRNCSNLYAFLGLNCETNREVNRTLAADTCVQQTKVQFKDKGSTEVVVTTAPKSSGMTEVLDLEKAMLVENFLACAPNCMGKTHVMSNDTEDFDFGFESPPELDQEDGDLIESDLFVNEDRLPMQSNQFDPGQSAESDALHESDDETILFCESVEGSPNFLIPDLVPPEASGIDYPTCFLYAGNVTGNSSDAGLLQRTKGSAPCYYVSRDFPAKIYHLGNDNKSKKLEDCCNKDENISHDICVEKLEELKDAMQNLKMLFDSKCSIVENENSSEDFKMTEDDKDTAQIPELVEASAENDETKGSFHEIKYEDTGPRIAVGPLEDHTSCNDSGISGDDDCNSNLSDSSDDERGQRMRRSSSLRTWKTPPGTPGRKKIVRFADAMGLDLADVRTFLDGVPNIPKSAYQDLDVNLDNSEENLTVVENAVVHEEPQRLIANFPQPGSLPDFIEKVKNRRVCLESAVIEKAFTLKGVIRLLNIGFYKSVFLRYTVNDWKSFQDVTANYVLDSCDGLTDKFDFSISLPQMKAGDKICFAICYRVSGQEFWDNNCGLNYSFTCVSSYLSPVCPSVVSPLDNSWVGFLD